MVPPPRLGAGRYGAVGLAATYQSFLHGVTHPNQWDGALRSEATLARYATLLSHTYSLVFVAAHNVTGRLVVAQPPRRVATATPAQAPGVEPTRGGEGGGGLGPFGSVTPPSEVEGANGGGGASRCLELRVYTPLAHCRTHRVTLSIDQVPI